MQVDLSDEQAFEVQRAIEAEIARTNEALSLPFIQAMPEFGGRAANTVRVLSEVLDALKPKRPVAHAGT